MGINLLVIESYSLATPPEQKGGNLVKAIELSLHFFEMATLPCHTEE
jgi:hypothetical protein